MGQIQLKQVSKSFGSTEVIPPLDLTIQDGEFTVFVGPSGCGKSTLLRLIAGLEDITSGHIEIDGEDATGVVPAKRGLAMVFQSYALYPHMSVRKNLAFGLQNMKIDKTEIDRRVDDAARILQIENLLDRKPRQLSGGQKQRAAIGRSIVREPELFLFDEPLSNLDAELRVQMRVELAELYKRLGTTMIYVTHDQVEAMTMASRIVVLRGGNIEQVGTPHELYERPANLFVAGFIGSPKINFVEARVSKNGATAVATLPDFGELPLPDLQDLSQDITLGLRPEALLLTGKGAVSAEGKVTLVEYLGSGTLVHILMPSGMTLLAQTDGANDYQTGETIRVGIDADALHYFDADGLRVAGA